MSALKDIYKQYCTSTGIDRENFSLFLSEIGIQLNLKEITTIYNMLLLENEENVHYKEIKTFLKATRVYDESKYPSTPITKRKKSYKVYPSPEIQTKENKNSEV